MFLPVADCLSFASSIISSKLEKQILKKEEEIMSKDNTIFELSDQVNELTHKIQNMKEILDEISFLYEKE